ncbi:MAG: cation transporter [Clostridia bacterium]|nr:cation transporter [Clostridia bacterium]
MVMPTIFSQIIVLIYNMADTFFLGRTNDPYMVAGVSLLLPVFNISIALSGLTGVGGGALVSRLLGEKREDEAKKVASFSFWLAFAMIAVFSLGMFLFIGPALRLLGASDDTFVYARQYAFCVIVLGGIPTVLSNVLSNLLRSVGLSRQAGLGITMGGLINIALDPLFMFVLLPKGREVLGVGIATLLSNCISCGYFLLVYRAVRQDVALRLSPKIGLPEKKSIRSVFNVGMPSAISMLLFDIDYIVIDRLMAGYGDIALAAIGIVLKAERLPLNVGVGICQGMLPLVAYNYASGDHRRMQKTIRLSLLVGLLVGAVSITLYEIFADGILRVFIAESRTVALGSTFLRVRCLATPLMFISFFTTHVFQGFGEGNRALFLGVVRWAVFNIPMLFLLNALIGMNGLVWAQVSADTLTVILSFSVYGSYVRRRFPKPEKTGQNG